MAVILGKRKRRTALKQENSESSGGSDAEDIQAAFRTAFEAKFRPLDIERPVVKPAIVTAQEDVEEEGEAESDWSGISGDEDVEVIEHALPLAGDEQMTKQEMRAFMSSRPPIEKQTKQPTARQKTQPAEDDEAETANLQNDLALQRLLKESHLLDPSASKNTTSPFGSNRHKATELRLQALGSKTSILTQDRMPMAHRKGIMAKSEEREERRRREAKENGIILERAKAAKATRGGAMRREGGVGAPGVGRFKSGTLQLSRRDVASIEGPKRGGGKSRGRGGKRGR
ncbi:pre-rRNA processing and 40S ribosomal subunit assembly [Elasticomyces elasticus]|nr:pre-rRNA processing and 40S ribosomal subunit assembly [Elasticomyces elasticus]